MAKATEAAIGSLITTVQAAGVTPFYRMIH
jgi:hypothetical protein